MEVETFFKPTTLVDMMAEMKSQNLAEQLTSKEKLTLQSDGTSKFGQHYGWFQVSMPDHSAYSLVLSEMLTGSAEVTLNILKTDIDLVVGEGVGAKILRCIKNTMSNRHVVEKKFNSLLEDYRVEILPMVVADWDVLSYMPFW